jgi:hypothetical protein
MIGVEDSGGCSFTKEVSIISEDKFTMSIETSGTTFSQNNGIIEIYLSEGGTPPYTYSLDNINKILNTNLTAVTINYVATGQHTISVIDGTGCSQTKQVYVPTVEPMTFFLYGEPADLGDNGKINVLISSGVPPFKYVWSENVSGNPQSISVSGLTAGKYFLTMIDSNNLSLKRDIEITGPTIYSSYETYEMGSKEFDIIPNSKYGILQLMTEGYLDITSGHTECDFISAFFIAEVDITPLGTSLRETFYTSTSLLDVPSENLWYDSLKSLILQVKGIKDVTIDEYNNQIKITSDINNSGLIKGPETIINVKINMGIEYNINCR